MRSIDGGKPSLELLGVAFAQTCDEAREEGRGARGDGIARVEEKVFDAALDLELHKEGAVREDDKRRRQLHRPLERISRGIGERGDGERTDSADLRTGTEGFADERALKTQPLGTRRTVSHRPRLIKRVDLTDEGEPRVDGLAEAERLKLHFFTLAPRA